MAHFPSDKIIGIVGGGQLGRMTAMAAARLGYRCHILCPEDDAPALQVAAGHTKGFFTDKAALERFASSVDLITLEWENVPIETLDVLARHVPVMPGAEVLRISQHRVLEKQFARQHGIGTADFVVIRSAEELAEALKTFPHPAILKSTRMGYDGKGQVGITSSTSPQKAWAEMGGNEGILEAFVDFLCEISVIVARRSDGVMVSYPVVENRHKNHILAETIAPANVPDDIAQEATALALRMAEKLEIVGLLAVEMFVLRKPNARGQRVLMNEIAPRPHNSGHWTIDACPCSQYEQLVRVICGLPLGSTTPHSKAVMRNLLGDDIRCAEGLLADPKACVHLYGKRETRAGRKMGHITFLGEAWEEKSH